MFKYEFIDNKAGLKRITEMFESESTIAVDLEADSMFHFQEKVCLIQMASKNLTVVIDPLEVKNLSVLRPVFADPAVRKIFHGGDYDVRSLHRDYQIEINNLFDTELASRFLGIPETGLSSVLAKRFGIKLDKSYQKKDWSKRPLSTEMIEYGASDVEYLLELADILDSELKEKNRTAWVEEECEILSKVRVAEPNGAPLFLRVKGAGRLTRKSLGVLEHLLELRQAIARKKDKPLFKVFANSSMLTIAKERPDSIEALCNSKALSSKQTSIYGKSILEKIQLAKTIPEEKLPVYPRNKKMFIKPDVPAITQKIKTWRDDLASELELDPPILFNKALLSAIAMKNPRNILEFEAIEGIKQWQKKEFGEQIVKILNEV